jgi:hypothetical protein
MIASLIRFVTVPPRVRLRRGCRRFPEPHYLVVGKS